MRNYVQNPSAEGSTLSLDSAASAGATIVADAVTGPGANAYQLTPTNQGTAALKLINAQRPAAVAGDRWWALFRARWVAGIGSRTLSCYLRFQDAAGNTLQTTQQDVTLTAPGTFRRWTAANIAPGGGTFEDGSTSGYGPNTGAPTLAVTTEQKRTGTRSLKVTSTSTSTADAAVLVNFTAASTGLHAVSYWVRSAQAFTAYFDTEYGSTYCSTRVAANTWTRIHWVVPINATGTRAIYAHHVFDSAVAGNVVYMDDVHVRLSASTSEEYIGTARRTNLASDPRALTLSIPNGLLGWASRWFGNGSAGTNSNVQGASDGPFGVTSYARKTWTTVSNVQDVGWQYTVNGTNAYPVTPGQTFSVSAWLRGSKTQPTRDTQNGMVVQWYDSSGTILSASTFGASDKAITAGEWVRYSVVATAPSGAAYMAPYVQVYLSATAWAAGDTLDGTALLVEQTGAVGTYFDGGLVLPIAGSSRSWAGAANLSGSVEQSAAGVTRTNRVLNPAPTSAAGWGGPNMTYDAVNRRVSYSASSAINEGGAFGAADRHFAAAGERRRYGGWFANTGTVPLNVSLQVQPRNASNAVLAYLDTAQVTVQPGAAVWLTNAYAVGYPVGTVQTQLFYRVGTGGAPVGSSWQVWQAIDTEYGDGSALQSSDYFDAAMVDTTLVVPTGIVSDVQQFAVTDVAPAGTAYATLLFVRQPGPNAVNTAPTAGDLFNLDALMLTQSASTSPPTYSDPNVDPTWFWSGAANASVSYTTAPDVVPIVAALDVGVGSRTEIRFQDLPAGVGAVNIYATADGRTFPVRGGIGKFATGGAATVDYEVPLQTPVSYAAEMFPDQASALASAAGQGSSGSLGFTGQTTVVVNDSRTWVHQPLDPSTGFSPLMLLGTAETITRESTGEGVYAEGSDVQTWLGGQRQGLSGLPVVMLMSMAQLQQLDAALGRYGTPSQVAVLIIRTPPPMPIPRLFYGTVPKTETKVLGAPRAGQEVQVSFTSDEARPVAPGLVKTQLRRSDLNAAYPTRAARNVAYLTRLARDSDYDLAGISG